MAARRQPPRKSSSTGPIVAVLLVFGLTGLAIWFLPEFTEEPEPPPETPRVDPFADLPPDLPPVRPGGTTPAAADPFADVSLLTQDEGWMAAVAQAKEAKALIEEARDLRAAGDRAAAAAKGKRAQELLEKALEDTAAFEEDAARRDGRDDPGVRQVIALRSAWVKDLVALKKLAVF